MNTPRFFKHLPPNFETGLKIPIYSDEHGLCPGNTREAEALLKRNGGDWRVDVVNGRFIGAGWRRFIEDNKLIPGGFVIFRPLENMVFEVTAFDAITQCKTGHGEGRPASRKSGYQTKASSSRVVGKEFPRDIETAKMANRQYRPYFTSTIKSYSTSFWYLNIPMDFARANGFLEKREMILVDMMERRWAVKMRYADTHMRIMGGWARFRDGNGIKEGDAFKFEIVENGDIPVVNFIV